MVEKMSIPRTIATLKKKSFEAIVREFPSHELQKFKTNITQGLAELKADWNSEDGSPMDLTFINDGEICLKEADASNDNYKLAKPTSPQVTRDLIGPYFN